MASFHFPTVEAALADDFPPDTISTDQYLRHVGSNPQHDLPRTMSKMLAAGLTESAVFAAVTSRPAEILGLESEIGTLATGSCADLVLLERNRSAAPLVDTAGNQREGDCFEAVCTIRAGSVVG
jgi:dihydroorotase